MDQHTNKLLELFNILLNQLSLPQDIFGYTATLLLLTVLLIAKLLVLTFIVEKLKTCKTIQFEISDLELA